MSRPRRVAVLVLACLLSSSASHTGGVEARTPAAAGYAAIFAGLSGSGGIWRSVDGGTTWQASSAGLAPGSVWAMIAGAGATLYASPGKAGVFRSDDGGASWHGDNGLNGSGPGAIRIYGLAVDPGDGRRVFALDEDGGFYRSADSGNHWSRSSTLITSFVKSTANDLQLDPLRPSTMLIIGDTGAELSTDYGATWQQIDDIPSVYGYSAVWSGANPDVGYASTADGVYQTIDGGVSWQPQRRGIPTGTAIVLVDANPANNSQVVATAKDGTLYRSVDGGTSWQQVGDTQGDRPDALAFDPAHAGVALVGTDSGHLYRSDDSGATWTQEDAAFTHGNAFFALAGGVRQALPTDTVQPPPPGTPNVYYARETHHTIVGAFLAFYNTYGGLKVFGLPLTEQFTEQGAQVQYFEHCALALTAGGVRLLPLSTRLGRVFAPAPAVQSTSVRLYFAATRHTLSGKFLTFWQTHHGPLLLGMPISEPLHEQNGDGTGRVYLVQYFQNMRLEYHPELAGTRYEVSIGLIGRTILQKRGWL